MSNSMSSHHLYDTWMQMKQRCYNPNNKSYKNYGARGIKVCDRWKKSFQNFLKDMGEKPSKKHTVERIDNNGNYEPENCRWATRKEQSFNRGYTVKYNVCGVRMHQKDLCELFNISEQAFRMRIMRGWTMKDALEKPLRALTVRKK